MRTSRPSTQLIATTVAVFAGAAQLACTSVTTPDIVVAKVVIAPSSATLRAGTQVALSATAYDAQGRALSGQPVVWVSKDSSVASVSPNGLVTGRTPGITLVAAGAEGQSGIAEVDVEPAAAPPPPSPPRPPSPPPPPSPPLSPPAILATRISRIKPHDSVNATLAAGNPAPLPNPPRKSEGEFFSSMQGVPLHCGPPHQQIT